MANSTIRRKFHLRADNRGLQDEHRTGQRPYITDRLYQQLVEFGDYSDSDTSEALDLNVAFPNNAFPADVIVKYAWLELYEVFTGGSVSAATVILGDAGDDNELVLSTIVFDGALDIKIGTDAIGRQELAYVPLLQLDTTDDDIDTLTKGKIGVFIIFSEIPNLAEGDVNN